MKVKSLLQSKMSYIFVIVAVLVLVAKFYIGFYQFESTTKVFIKPAPVWKSVFSSPVYHENKKTPELTEEERYEQEMFGLYASDDFLKIAACDDIFSRFTNKPIQMEYIGCDVPVDDIQTIAVSNYQVAGENVLEIESYLTEHHFMPPMKAMSWGFETRRSIDKVGNRGLEDSLRLINPAITVDIEMSGAKEEQSYDRYGSKHIDTVQKEDVPYYFISVNLIKI